MKVNVGTSGFSYKEWQGPFYPEKLPAKEMLSYYAGQLPAVEINNTFYRMPKTSVLEDWCERVPQHFRFAIKASRRITHFKRLKEADEPTGFLLNAARALGERLGVLLFQLPPNLKLDLDRLKTFADLLPEGTRAAFEFRHPSWSDTGVFDLLRARDFALVHVDAVDAGESAAEIEATASWGYLRLRRPDYEREDLASWAQRIRNQPWSEAFVFFKHEDEGAGPRMAADFLATTERSEARKGPKSAPPATPERASRREAG